MKTKFIGVKLTPEQYRAIEQRAERCKVRMSTWIREVSLQAASRPAREGFIRIKEPDGALI